MKQTNKPPAVRPYSFRTDGYGIFNVRTNLGACRTHEGGSGTNKSAQELTRRDKISLSYPAPPGDQTQGLWMKNSNTLTTELCPPSVEHIQTLSAAESVPEIHGHCNNNLAKSTLVRVDLFSQRPFHCDGFVGFESWRPVVSCCQTWRMICV